MRALKELLPKEKRAQLRKETKYFTIDPESDSAANKQPKEMEMEPVT